MKKRRVLITGDEAVPCATQHKTPCSDCPFRRDSVPGWLGTMTVEQWIDAVHGESRIDCHTLIGPQCAGAAIYRANVCKLPRDKSLLVLRPDERLVFAWRDEFEKHHTK